MGEYLVSVNVWESILCLCMLITYGSSLCFVCHVRIQQYLRDQDGSNWRSKLPINPEAESVMAAYYAQAAAQQLPCGGAVPPVVTSTASSPTSSATAVTNTTSTITNVTETSEAAGGGGASETDNKIGKFEMLKVQGNALVKKVIYKYKVVV